MNLQGYINDTILLKHKYENQIMFFTYIFSLMILFGVSYIVLKYILRFCDCKNTDSKKTKGRSMTTQWIVISSIVTTYLGITPLLKHGYFVNHITCEKLLSTTSSSMNESIPLLAVFVAYLWYDLMFNNISYMYVCHHLICCLPVIWVVCIDHTPGIMFSEILMIAEISTIFLNLKMITNGIINKILSLVFMITFILIRPIYMPQVLFKMFECWEQNFTYNVIIVAFVSLMIMNFYWSVLIIRKGIKSCINIKSENINKID
jgi:hypothetical protein